MIRFGAAALAAILVFAAAPAFAQHRPPTISTAAVNFSDPSAVSAVHRAVVRKARGWCRAQFVPTVHTRAQLRWCIDETVRATLMESGEPALVALAEPTPPMAMAAFTSRR